MAGYGAGGCGGGEYASESFMTGTSGGSGVVYSMYTRRRSLTVSNKIKVNVNGTLYPIPLFVGPNWNIWNSNSLSHSKMTFGTPMSTSRAYRNRQWSFNQSNGQSGFRIFGTSQDMFQQFYGEYDEVRDITGWKTGWGLATSKIVRAQDNLPLKIFYHTGGTAGKTYFTSIYTNSYTSGSSNLTLSAASGETLFYCFLVQGAGGGGGGPDWTYKLWNYAGGGGGGGGGGAACYLVTVPAGKSYYATISVGSGGSFGQGGDGGTDGGGGGASSVRIFSDSGRTSEVARIECYGGSGGKGGAEDPGAGGGGGGTNIWDNAGILTKLAIVDGGAGGGGAGGGGQGGVSGDFSTTISSDMFDITITASSSRGSGGGVNGGQSDPGGGGGASWLSNGDTFYA